MGWTFQGIIVFIANACLSLFKVLFKYTIWPITSGSTILEQLSESMGTTINGVIIGLAIFVAVGILIFQLFKSMFYKTAGTKTDPPAMLVIKFILVLALIVSAAGIEKWIIKVGQIPFSTDNAWVYEDKSYFYYYDNQYNVFFDSNQTTENDAVLNGLTNFRSQVDVQTKDYQLTNNGAVETTDKQTVSGLRDGGASLVSLVVVTIGLLFLLISFVKFIFNIIEQYLILNLAIICFPLGISTAHSMSTAEMTRKYLEILVSSFIIFFIEMLSLRLVYGAFAVAFSDTATVYSPILSLFMLVAIMGICGSLDRFVAGVITSVVSPKRYANEMLHTVRSLPRKVQRYTDTAVKGINKTSELVFNKNARAGTALGAMGANLANLNHPIKSVEKTTGIKKKINDSKTKKAREKSQEDLSQAINDELAKKGIGTSAAFTIGKWKVEDENTLRGKTTRVVKKEGEADKTITKDIFIKKKGSFDNDDCGMIDQDGNLIQFKDKGAARQQQKEMGYSASEFGCTQKGDKYSNYDLSIDDLEAVVKRHDCDLINPSFVAKDNEDIVVYGVYQDGQRTSHTLKPVYGDVPIPESEQIAVVDQNGDKVMSYRIL